MKKTFSILAVLLFSLSVASFADVKLSGVLTSNMVIQRDRPITIWGWADKGEKVNVTFNNLKKSARADKAGDWKVVFPAMKAGGGALQLKVQGKNTITLDNILIGDVWVCSGQSNMGVTMRDVNNSEKEIADANYPNIRLFDFPRNLQPQPVNNTIGNPQWKECSPENIRRFSAVAYFFGRDVYKEINVPIGLLHTSCG